MGNGFDCIALMMTLFITCSLFLSTPPLHAQDPSKPIPHQVFSPDQRKQAEGMLEEQVVRLAKEANLANRQRWQAIANRDDWERFRDRAIAGLRRSLADWPEPPASLNFHFTGVTQGDGFQIKNVVYETRPGFWANGNLYVPRESRPSMPGILIAHSHHGGKTDRELQDMGMTWARAGCLVLVIDQVGYGERRSHPFHTDADYAKPYRPGRQDYFFRQDTGMQLHLLGDSLMGWMAWDLMRGVDLLLAQEGVDPRRIILLGAVAGGGDPAGVTAALDKRIACCVPFNFGGPQPESPYPLPDDAETRFDYLGGAYWESTRGLRLGARDEFFHWVITSSIAPRRLIHAHEFSWDQERDPVWKRYQKIWGEFYGAADQLGFAHGKGLLKGQPPEASHCNNIGAYHRKLIHPLFDRWFDIKVTEADEYSAPRTRAELTCWTDEARAKHRPNGLNETMGRVAAERIEVARKKRQGNSPTEIRKSLRDDWASLLGMPPGVAPKIVSRSIDDLPVNGTTVERIVLETEPGILVPVVLMLPAKAEPMSPDERRAPTIVAVSHAGKKSFLSERASELKRLNQAGYIVALPDVRGTAEAGSAGTDISANLQLHGQTLLGQQLVDVRSVLAWLRNDERVDAKRLGVWGDASVPPNPPETNYKIPRRVDEWPVGPQPLGGLLAMLTGLFEDDVQAIYVACGLSSYQESLSHFAMLLPHGTVVPGALTTGDLCDLASGLAPKPLRMEATVDPLNRLVPVEACRKSYAPTIAAYASTPGKLGFSAERTSPAAWFAEHLR